MKYLFRTGFNFILVLVAVITLLLTFGFSIGKNLNHSHLSNNQANNENLSVQNFEEFFDLIASPADSTGSDSASISVIDTSFLNPANLDSLLVDSLALDSLLLDSLSIDSTARIKQFKVKRYDAPNLQFSKKKQSAFFVRPSQNYYKRTIELDSTKQFVVIKEKYGDFEPREFLKIPVEEFVKLKLSAMNRELWAELVYKYDLKDLNKDLSQLISEITNIEIPLPSSSFFSIFGPPIINLRIGGAVDIHGAWRSETTEGITSSRLGNTRNEPDFKQTVQINVNGTIGDKLTIRADWNTERTFEYENQLKLEYKGYEDEIIQSIEAGNVSLQTSSLVGGGEALFGVKAKFKMGPLSLTALASQKKGEIEEVSITGGSSTKQFEKHAYEYSQNHYFLDTTYASTASGFNFFNNYYGNPSPVVNQLNDQFRVKEIEVWKSTQAVIDKQRERKANVYINLAPQTGSGGYDIISTLRDTTQTPVEGKTTIKTRFIRLEEDLDYTWNPYTGVISFNSGIQPQDIIAAAFRTEGNGPGNDDDNYYGEFVKDAPNDSVVMILKMIKPENLQPGFETAWKLQLKNIYPIGGREIKKEGFSLDIKRVVDGADPVNEIDGFKLLEEFGLDKIDNAGGSNPDGNFDFRPGITILPSTGEIIFPVLQPFGDQFPANIKKPEFIYNSIYDTTISGAQNDKTFDKFLIAGEFSAAVTSTHTIGFNVVENSVKVLLNGNELREGSDYSVDYNIGQVTIRNDAALVANADLRITYEQNDLFSLASKTLIGLRGLYEFSRKTTLGFSFLNLNQQTLSDKVRIGEEPLKNSIYGVDFNTSAELPFLTRALDKVISTSAPSNFSLKGEFAYINPDPNTKKSTIERDEDKSIAYIDDFEGSKRTIPIGIVDRGWKDISKPNELEIIGNFVDTIATDLSFKGKSFWYTVLPSNVKVQDIFGNRKIVAREDELVSVLDFVFRPDERGTYNSSPQLNDPTLAWGGMMKGLSSTANNLIEENIQFIEFWVKLEDNTPTDTKLYIDLGQISEDVFPNQALNTEDRNDNDIEEDTEDTGIDGLFDEQEPGYDPVNNPDPNNDNFAFVQSNVVNPPPGDFIGINGTEGNREFRNAGIKFPDTEDLDRNRTLDRINSYFRYEVSLDTNRMNNEFITGGGEGLSWYLFRIPLKDARDSVGTPSLSIVKNIRFWVGGASQDVHLRFAEINLVGNQWERVLTNNVTREDEVLTIGTINVEDNPAYFSPPGVFREKDRSKPDQEVFKNEQSLELLLNELPDGDRRETIKYLYRPLDVFNYKEMKFFIHGDEFDGTPTSVSYFNDINDYASEVYFRFGSDTNNFYEYRQPVKRGWNEVQLIFEELTAIKEARKITDLDSLLQFDVPGKPGQSFGVKGQPALTKISFFLVGILNPVLGDTSVGFPVSGSIWINELRVLNADDSPGWAYTASTSINFADLLSVSANLSQTNPYFHRIADRFGSRVDRMNWGITSTLDVLKLSPVNLPGSNLKVTYSRNESISKPLYLPGTDVFVDSAAAQRERSLIADGVSEAEAKVQADELKKIVETESVSESWNLSGIKLKIPSDAWYFRDTWNALTFGFNYNKSRSRSPTVLKNTTWVWNANANYSINFSNDYFLYPANIPVIGWVVSLFSDYRNAKVFFTPQNFSAKVSAKRNRSFSQSRPTGTATDPAVPRVQRDFTANRSFQFNWKLIEGAFLNPSINYSVNINSSLAHLLTVNDIEREENQIWSDIFAGSPFGKDNDYAQNFDLKLNPKFPNLWDFNKYFSITASYGVNYNWRFNFQQDTLGRSAQFSSNLRTGVTLRWKSLTAPLFKEDPKSSTNVSSTNRGRGRTNRNLPDLDEEKERTKKEDELEPGTADSTAVAEAEEEIVTGPSSILKLLNFMKLTAKWLFFDYDQFAINFSQTNSMGNSGIEGRGTGFNNFWGFNQSDDKGPGRLYQLGLSLDPGKRAANGNLSNNFSQKNNIDFKTSRPLWEGAQIDLNWKVGWGLNKNTTIRTDSDGNVSVTNVASTTNLNRSFLSFPPTFFLTTFGSGIKKVAELYDPDVTNPNENLSTAFLEGFESAPLVSKLPIFKDVAKFIPRPNWRLTWNGLEKIGFFKGFAQRVSLSHAYTSTYNEGSKINADGDEEITKQSISYGFAPLLGLNMTFNDVWEGKLSGSIKYGTKTSYDLGVSTRNISESFEKDISITASFSKSGFEIPLFGVSLKNDIEISFSYTTSKNSIVIFKMDDFNEEGEPQDGTSRTSIEPRLKYIISSRVTMSLFYKHTSVVPEGASRIPETSTNEAGLDISIAIRD